MKEKFYKISQPNGLIEFIETDGIKTQIVIFSDSSDNIPFEVTFKTKQWCKVENNGELTYFSLYYGVLRSTKCFTEISEAEFEEQVKKFMNQVYPNKTTEQNVRSLAT